MRAGRASGGWPAGQVESHEATPELMTESTGEKTPEAAFGPTE